jgi:hypothetical protein
MTAPTPAPLFRFRFVFDGEAVIDREVAALETRLDAPLSGPGVVDEVVGVFRAAVREAFATEGGSTGSPWPALARSTQAERRRLGFGPAHPILRRTNELLGSITGGGGGFVETTPTSIAIGSNDPVFWFHQSRRPRTRLPRRAMVLLTLRNKSDMLRPIMLHVTGRGAGGARRAAPV